MSNITDFINGIVSSQNNNPLTTVNQNEFDGNTNDLLFNTDQAAQSLSVSGGTTLTAIAPQNFVQDLTQGKLTPVVIIYLVIAFFVFKWLMKK